MLNRTCNPPIGPIGLIKILEASSMRYCDSLNRNNYMLSLLSLSIIYNSVN